VGKPWSSNILMGVVISQKAFVFNSAKGSDILYCANCTADNRGAVTVKLLLVSQVNAFPIS